MRLWFVKDAHSVARDEFSEYLDGRLSPQRRGRLEAHVARCQACREDLEALRATIALAQSLPQAAVPRSFRISEAQVAPPAQEPFWYGLLPGLRLASAAVGVLLFAVVAVDALGGLQAAAPLAGSAAMQAPKAALEAETPVQRQEAPVAVRSQGTQEAGEALPEFSKAMDKATPAQAPQAVPEPRGVSPVSPSVSRADNRPLRVLEVALLVTTALMLAASVALSRLRQRRVF